MTDAEYEKWGQNVIKDHSIHDYSFTDDRQKNALIVYFISNYGVLDNYYSNTIQSFLTHPFSLYFRGYAEIGSFELIKTLFNDKSAINYYGVIKYLSDFESLKSFLTYFYIDDLIYVIGILDNFFYGENRQIFIRASQTALKSAIDDYCDYIDADDYDPDVMNVTNSATVITEYGNETDVYEAASCIEEEVAETVKQEIYDKIRDLPEDIDLGYEYIDDLIIDVSGADILVDSYLDENDEDEGYNEPESQKDDSEIDYIFDREYELK